MSVTYENSYRGYTVNADSSKGCRTDILDKIIAQTEDMTGKHDKVLQVRFDIHYPKGMSPEELPQSHHSKFVNRLTQDLNRNYKLPEEGRQRSSGKNLGNHDPDPRIILVREQHSQSDNQHIHGLLLVNANAYHYPPGLMKRVERQVKNMLGVDDIAGLVHYCNDSGPGSYMLKRNDPDFNERMNNAVHQSSYLAKERGKDNLPKGAWSVIGTRLPK